MRVNSLARCFGAIYRDMLDFFENFFKALHFISNRDMI
jgi:hypothetical protein